MKPSLGLERENRERDGRRVCVWVGLVGERERDSSYSTIRNTPTSTRCRITFLNFILIIVIFLKT